MGLNVVKFFGDNDVERSELESLEFCLLRYVCVFEEKGRSNEENRGGQWELEGVGKVDKRVIDDVEISHLLYMYTGACMTSQLHEARGAKRFSIMAESPSPGGAKRNE